MVSDFACSTLHSPNKGSHKFGKLKGVAFTIIYKFYSNSCDSVDVIFGICTNIFIKYHAVVYFTGNEATKYLCVSFKSLKLLL